ncbi:translation initiation factor IF-6 [Marine Group I thaumarchaeote]|uniref:Translation initiation factor 6 n=1 Tax=Marine Group I thaumarchaeote TaxID=2511932 RepID=A0A7K4NML0_9ARCH|nr:translation initiation factor IF-6 [Marine Group I thaumarchaeote]NWK02566.1 translation initiation factor IF-6 [Marine Group I thaumarchaeote]RZD34192.1 MAG: translation initiation factor IF-6 [Nitrososphaerota archaeon]
MDIIKYDVYSGPNIGIFTSVNDKFVFIPNGFAKTKAENLARYLQTEYLMTPVANTRLLGILMVLNNHGILLPKTSSPDEIANLRKCTDLNVKILDTKYNALGNLICVNDKGGVISPIIEKEFIKEIEDVLDIEVIQKKVAGFHQVGAVMEANNLGGIIHPEADEEDIKNFSNVLGVNLEPATINGGIPFVSSGMLANSNAVVVGNLTNGPEIMMLTRAFTN